MTSSDISVMLPTCLVTLCIEICNSRYTLDDLNAGPSCSDLNAGPSCSDLNAGPSCSDLNAGPSCSDLNAGPSCSVRFLSHSKCLIPQQFGTGLPAPTGVSDYLSRASHSAAGRGQPSRHHFR